jgi:23S rRNA (guanine745-N1)-methyltransferase
MVPMNSAASLPDDVVRALRCSVCGSPVALAQRVLRCPEGHAFDLARQGYVNLLHARTPAGTADTVEMVAARADFLSAGHYEPLADLVADSLTPIGSGGLVVDAGAGTGYYLAHTLDRLPGTAGLALDVSAVALRRAARAHPRIGAAVWNLWQDWPVATGTAAGLLNVFAPRNPREFHRVLRPDGVLVVASPGPSHLAELRASLGLLDVDRSKQARLDDLLGELFTLDDRAEHTATVTLPAADARRAVLMGPSAHHLERRGLGEQLDRLHEPVVVTLSFTVSRFAKRS